METLPGPVSIYSLFIRYRSFFQWARMPDSIILPASKDRDKFSKMQYEDV